MLELQKLFILFHDLESFPKSFFSSAILCFMWMILTGWLGYIMSCGDDALLKLAILIFLVDFFMKFHGFEGFRMHFLIFTVFSLEFDVLKAQKRSGVFKGRLKKNSQLLCLKNCTKSVKEGSKNRKFYSWVFLKLKIFSKAHHKVFQLGRVVNLKGL